MLKKIFPQYDFSVKSLLGLTFDRMTAAEESCGYKYKSYVGNMATYVFIVVMTVLGALSIFIIIYILCGFRSRIKKNLNDQIEKAKSISINGAINGIHASYLESCIVFQMYVHTLDFTGWRRNWFKLLPRVLPIFITYLFPFLELVVLAYFWNNLKEKWVIDKVGAIYADTAYEENHITCLYKPIMLIRRLIFISLPFISNHDCL